MFLALVADDLTEPTEAGPRRATCPCCQDDVIAKTGEVVSWHWAHRARADCDPWAEGETDWHLDWKRAARDRGARLEVPMRDPSGAITHRADIVTPEGIVIEVQHSRLPPASVQEREAFYSARGGLRWIFDGPALGWMTDPRDRSHGAYGREPWPWLLDRFGGTLAGVWGQFGAVPRMLDAVRAPMAWDIREGPLMGSEVARWTTRPFAVKAWREWIVRLEDAPDVLTSTLALRGGGIAEAPSPSRCHVAACGGEGHFVMHTKRATYLYCYDHVAEYRAACVAGVVAA